MDPERVVIDTERVIAAVRARPQIWEPTHELYKNRDARLNAWTAVGRSVVPQLRALARADQRDIEKKIQQRWRTARDCFVKARAQLLGGAGGAGGARPERGYGYYDAMTFLEPTLRLPLKVQKGLPPPPRRRALTALERRLLALLRERCSPLDEDDDNFFKSLAPMLRALAPHQKLVFRSRVLALALDAHAAPPAPPAHADTPSD